MIDAKDIEIGMEVEALFPSGRWTPAIIKNIIAQPSGTTTVVCSLETRYRGSSAVREIVRTNYCIRHMQSTKI